MAPTGGTVASLGGGKGRGHGPNHSSLPVALDGSQVAASNSTLNAWVGGRRQPSWLANATPVQPTPRPPRPPPIPVPPIAAGPATEMVSSQPQPQPKPQPQSQSQPQSRPPHQPRRQSQHNNQAQARSSDQTSHQPVQSPPASLHPQPAASQPSQAVTAPGPPRLSTSSTDPVLLSSAPSEEPSPCLSLHNSLNTLNPYPVGSHNDPPTTDAQFVLDSHVNSQSLSSPPSRDLAPPVNNGQVASPRGTVQVHPPLTASSSREMALNTPPTPTVAGSGNAGPTPQDTSRPITSKRRRVENSALVFLEIHKAQTRLDGYLQEVGGELGLEEVVERPRFLLLQKACRDGDLFFIALHQLFCSWTASQVSVHRLCDENVHDTSLVDNAFGIMGTVLKANSKLREAILQWFAGFPAPLVTLQLDRFYARVIHQVLDFLICVSRKWSIVNHDHLLRGYPLLMSELINTFRLYSPILQSIVFRASRRTLGVHDQPMGIRLDDLFRADQEKHRQHDGAYSLRLEGVAYDEYNNSLIQNYVSLVTRYKSTSHVRSSNSPSIPPTSTAHSSGASSPSMAGEHLQADMTHGIRPAPPPINTGRVVPSSGQSIHSPSPTYSPIAPPPPSVITNNTTTITPQFAAMTSHVLPSSPAVGITTSSYQSANIFQQGQYRTSNLHTQQSIQPQHYDHFRQQQLQQQQLQQQQLQQQKLQQQQLQQHRIQQQHQQLQQLQQQQHQQQSQLEWQFQHQQLHHHQLHHQQQQFQYLHRKRSQPGAAPSPRPSPVQTTRSLPGQGSPTGQLSAQFQNFNSQPVPAAPFRNLAPFPGSPNLAHQPGLVDPLLSPRAVNAVQPNNVRPRSLVGPQRQPAQASDRLIPPSGFRINLQDYPHTPYEKRSVDHSLHQAHLRSPRRIPKVLSTASPERHYQAIKEFALEPTPVPPQPYLYEFTFNIPDTVYEKLTLNERVAGEILPVSRYSNGSLRIRARCCNQPTTTDSISDHVWVTTETTWPDHIFMSLNDQVVEIKRKQHHSKDLPVELSSLVHIGVNTLSISILVPNTQRKQQNPYFAVEIVEVLSHSAVVQMVHVSGSRPANETREMIRRRLAGCLPGLTGDDNDLEIPSDGISIDLADPFTSTIFTVPVRGKACTHLECFDLENWLNTRLAKKSPCVCNGLNCRCPKEPSFVDKWRCPFCDGDARPYSLRIDEFLVEIRSRLEKDKQLRTKSITVFADGSWKTNDPAGDDDSDTESDDNGTRATSRAASKPSVPRNIIELDDE
ncbi:hypothetical protein EKO27_g5526 [Xylaria grammica]|uniref:SP-RING-type domain-containing protein n=1 Tax=Xylaria grammica TaxID=363999 RepID=A0A439D5A8_9PEZI|nr:hypothetical protein EKO27_g5526 [Xylaria grammica]